MLQMELINECSLRFAEDKDFRLLVRSSRWLDVLLIRFQIVDSIMALFRVDYSGRGELSERQQKVCFFANMGHRSRTNLTFLVGPGPAMSIISGLNQTDNVLFRCYQG